MDLVADVRKPFALCLQYDVAPEAREEIGLHAVFREAFPLDLGGGELVYVSYALEQPRRDAEACRYRGLTWAAPLKLTVQLVAFDEKGPDRKITDIKEQEVYFGEVPLMTEQGTFIIDGEERVLADASESLTHAFADGVAATLGRIGRLNKGDIETLMPHDLINAKSFALAVRNLMSHAEVVRTQSPITQIEDARGEPCAEMLAPFPCDVETAREALGAARVLFDPEPPITKTGVEGDFARAAGLLTFAGVDGELCALSTSAVAIFPSDKAAAFVLEPRRWVPSRRRVCDRLVRASGPVSATDIVFECDGASNGKLALGRNARVRFDASAKGAVVSEAFARAMRASEVFIAEAQRKDTRKGTQGRLAGPGLGLDASGIVPLGASVREGDLLVGISTPEEEKRDPSLRVRKGVEGKVVRVDVFARAGAERSARHEAIIAEREQTWNEIERIAKERADDARWKELSSSHEPPRWIREELPRGVVEMVRVTIEREIPLAPGARLADRHGAVFAIDHVDAGLDVDAVLPGNPTDTARREVEAGGLYLLHLPPAPRIKRVR